MDRFEEMAARMAAMPEEDLKKTVSSLMAMCICGRCPSMSECMREKKETLYCALGKSGCPVPKKGCLCPPCPVTREMGLRHAYYCVRGTEKEIRGL